MTDTLRQKIAALGERNHGVLPQGEMLTLLDEHCAGQREMFEKWCLDNYNKINLTVCEDDNEYFDSEIQFAWEAYQAAIATITGKG